MKSMISYQNLYLSCLLWLNQEKYIIDLKIMTPPKHSHLHSKSLVRVTAQTPVFVAGECTYRVNLWRLVHRPGKVEQE